MSRAETQLDRIERKVDQIVELQRAMVDALAEEEAPAQQTTLEGGDAGAERDQGKSLDTGD